jgi:hypothetical protein
MKLIRRQKVWLAIVLITNAVLWAVPSDVVEQIARDRHTMLGRYSRTHFAWNVGVLAFSIVSLYVDWATGAAYKRRWFQVLAVTLFLVPSLVIVDFLARSPQRSHYVRPTPAYHHPANENHSGFFEDKPEAYRTYPNAPCGYPKFARTLRTDARGFRNAVALDQSDVVTIGDSFGEGSGVSDEHPWPVVLGSLTGMRVYNLGMSGYDPPNYLQVLKEYGLPLRPRYVLCMLYEGNDFRTSQSVAEAIAIPWSERFRTYMKQSPLIQAADQFLIQTFGPLRSTAPVAGAEILDWLPLAIPAGPQAKYYAFAPKQLRDLNQSAEEFAYGRKWLATRSILEEMDRVSREAGARLVFVFAPAKAHVTLPLAADRLDAAKVRAFTALDGSKELPPAEIFLVQLLARADARETVVRDWCARAQIPFISTTAALRSACAKGVQAYFTYDQHWTPEGHRTVAEVLAGFLQQQADSVRTH